MSTEFVRVSGSWVCPECGKEARDHPTSRLVTEEFGEHLVELCDGRLAKL